MWYPHRKSLWKGSEFGIVLFEVIPLLFLYKTTKFGLLSHTILS